MNPLTKVRDKFIYEAGIVADKNNPRYDEQLVNTAILTPICAIRKGEFEYGRTYRHYMIDGNVYKSRKKFLVALDKVETPIEQSH